MIPAVLLRAFIAFVLRCHSTCLATASLAVKLLYCRWRSKGGHRRETRPPDPPMKGVSERRFLCRMEPALGMADARWHPAALRVDSPMSLQPFYGPRFPGTLGAFYTHPSKRLFAQRLSDAPSRRHVFGIELEPSMNGTWASSLTLSRLVRPSATFMSRSAARVHKQAFSSFAWTALRSRYTRISQSDPDCA